MLCNSNNGMYLETLLNRTSNHYKESDKLLFFKRSIPINIYKNENGNIHGRLIAKSQTDYYGIYKGRYIDFEAKQTNKNYFYIKNLKNHQFEHLKEIKKLNGISFLILHFSKEDEFFCINTKKLEEINCKITRDWCKQNAFELKLIFPGILNIIEYLKKEI